VTTVPLSGSYPTQVMGAAASSHTLPTLPCHCHPRAQGTDQTRSTAHHTHTQWRARQLQARQQAHLHSTLKAGTQSSFCALSPPARRFPHSHSHATPREKNAADAGPAPRGGGGGPAAAAAAATIDGGAGDVLVGAGAAARGVDVRGQLRGARGRADAQHGRVRARRGAHRASPGRAGRHAAVRAARGVAHGPLQPHLPHDALPRPRRHRPRHPGTGYRTGNCPSPFVVLGRRHCQPCLATIELISEQDTSSWPLIDPLPSYGRGRELPGGRYMSLIHGHGLQDVFITGSFLHCQPDSHPLSHSSIDLLKAPHSVLVCGVR
jgi:hypothetical protein